MANSEKGLHQLMANLNKVTTWVWYEDKREKDKGDAHNRKGNNKLKIYVDGHQVVLVSQLGSVVLWSARATRFDTKVFLCILILRKTQHLKISRRSELGTRAPREASPRYLYQC